MSASDTISTSNAEDLAYAKSILQGEAAAVAQLATLLDGNFVDALGYLRNMPEEGRVILSGMGKAGFIAQKISATFASIGVPSFFLHPAEAVHGDLGRYARKDIAMLLSNSGETPEMIRTLPHIKRIGCPILSLTASATSTLAHHSDVVLAFGKLTEAGPLGLAPTTSTTVMLALGDALVMALYHKRNHSPEQFAFYHPGGNLGRSLVLVQEVMRRDDAFCVVPQEMTTSEVLHRICSTARRPGAAAVTDAKGTLRGIFTDGDLRRCLEHGRDFLQRPIEEVMGRAPKRISPDKLAQEALRIMSEHKIDQLVVVNAGDMPLGMVDIQDLIDFR